MYVCQAASQRQSGVNRKPSRTTDFEGSHQGQEGSQAPLLTSSEPSPGWAATHTHSAGSGMGSAITLDSSSAISCSFHFRRWTYGHRA